MKIAIFDSREYTKYFYELANSQKKHDATFFTETLTLENVHLVKGFDAVSGFVNTKGNAEIMKKLKEYGVKFWFQRSIGYNNIDMNAVNDLDIHVWRVPNYSVETVAEHALTLLLAVNRRIIKARDKTRNGNFLLDDLQGKCIHSSVIGLIGAGQIGQAFIKAAKGLGATVLVFDTYLQKNSPELAQKLGFEFSNLDSLLKESDFISLHAPLLPETKHIIDSNAISKMKNGVILVNTARGELVDTTALIEGLKSKKIAGAGLDVLERESGRFFSDKSNEVEELKKQDPEWKYLMESDDVILTAHQAFFSDLALKQIARISLQNADEAEQNILTNKLKL